MKEVIFIVDFATKKKGETLFCDSLLASHLVHLDKVAEYNNTVKKEKKVK